LEDRCDAGEIASLRVDGAGPAARRSAPHCKFVVPGGSGV